jgi:hypothetical protein
MLMCETVVEQEDGEDREMMAVRERLPAWDKRKEIIRSLYVIFFINLNIPIDCWSTGMP